MGCAASTALAAPAQDAPSTERSSRVSVRAAVSKRASAIFPGKTAADTVKQRDAADKALWDSAKPERSRMTRRRSSASSSSLSSRLSNGLNIFGTRLSTRRNSDAAQLDQDPLALGKDSQAAGAPQQWLVVIGTRGSGKSTLIRQVKQAHDGLDLAEAARYTREVHKLAQGLVKQVVKAALPLITSSDERLKIMAERVLAMPRRAMLTATAATDIEALWQSPHVRESEAKLADEQARRACRHFVRRIAALCEDGYVPEAQDVMHMAVPTVGQQETRVKSFPGGAISLFELNVDPNRSSILGANASSQGGDLFGRGLRGLVFVTSLLDYEQDSSSPRVRVRADALKLWHRAKTAATTANVPLYRVMSKRDLLRERCAYQQLLGTAADPRAGSLSSTAVEAAMGEQFAADLAPAGTAGAPSSAPAPAPAPALTFAEPSRSSAKTSTPRDVTLSVDLLEPDHGGAASFIELMVQHSFPELEFDENAAGALGDAVHVCLAFFCSDDAGSILSRNGALPAARWQGAPLKMEDHSWLHDLPDPLPNPRHASDELAARLGKDSSNATQAAFFAAISALADQLGGFEPEILGRLHTSPLLTTSGALLVVFKQDFITPPSLGVNRSRGLKWRPRANVASRLAQVAQAAEFKAYRMNSHATSYAADVREMLAETTTRELMPSLWLERVRECSSVDVASLRDGTYMTAFYTLSHQLDGLQILLSEQEHMSMPPFVRISDRHLTPSEWEQLSTFGRDAKAQHSTSTVPQDWSAAKGWLGPDVSSEKPFSAMQKFFFGLIHLRQRLERRCDATRDELRYSRVEGATETLIALGELYTSEIVLADPTGRIQLIVVCRHHDQWSTDQFPKAMRWVPFPLFEAQHLKNFMPDAQRRVSRGKQIIAKGKAAEERLVANEANALRGSGAKSMHWSGMRSSSDMPLDLSAVIGLHDLRTSNPEQRAADRLKLTGGVPPFGPADESALEDAWEHFRWTKRVVHSLVERLRMLNAFTVFKTPTFECATAAPVAEAYERMKEHVKAVIDTAAALDEVNSNMSARLQDLEAKVAQVERDAGGGA